MGGWFVEVKVRKAEAGLKSRFFLFFRKLLFRGKRAQASHLFLGIHSQLGNGRLPLGGLGS